MGIYYYPHKTKQGNLAMKVGDLKKELKEHLKPHGAAAKIINYLPSFFHPCSPVIRQLLSFSKSLKGNDNHLSVEEEYALGEILFAERKGNELPPKEDHGFVERLKDRLWGIHAGSVFEGLKLLKANSMLNEAAAESVKNSTYSGTTMAEAMIRNSGKHFITP
jgi:hypothetical protein